MCSHIERECQFLYDFSFKRKREEFLEAIHSASQHQICALVELIVNRHQFLQSTLKFNIKALIRNPKKSILKHWSKVQRLVAITINEVVHCETCMILLSAEEETENEE